MAYLQDSKPARLRLNAQFIKQRGFANPRRSRNEHDHSLSGMSLAKAAAENLKLLVSSEQRAHSSSLPFHGQTCFLTPCAGAVFLAHRLTLNIPPNQAKAWFLYTNCMTSNLTDYQ